MVYRLSIQHTPETWSTALPSGTQNGIPHLSTVEYSNQDKAHGHSEQFHVGCVPSPFATTPPPSVPLHGPLSWHPTPTHCQVIFNSFIHANRLIGELYPWVAVIGSEVQPLKSATTWWTNLTCACANIERKQKADNSPHANVARNNW